MESSGEGGAGSIDETTARDPTLLPGYQTEPLFGKHEPRNEIEYDEVKLYIFSLL